MFIGVESLTILRFPLPLLELSPTSATMPEQVEVRSRNGCANCRRRRRKCTEERPRCKGCVSRDLPCEYTSFRLRWAETDGAAQKRRPAQKHRKRRQAEEQSIENQNHNDAQVPTEHFYHIPSGTAFISNATLIARQLEGRDAGESDNGVSPTTEGGGDVDVDSEGDPESWELVDDEIFAHMNLPPDQFTSPGERIAFAYWFNHLSGVLPAYDSAENPYRRLSTLALASPVLLDTIISLATEYMYCHGRAAPNVVMQRHDKALASLREALISCDNPAALDATGEQLSSRQSTLAAVLLQICNLVFIGGSGVDVHLACAMHFLRDLDYIDHPVDDFLPRLLVQRFAMLDVTLAILRHRRPHLPPGFWLFLPDDKYDRTVPSFREMTGCPQPVLGFLARLANLSVDLRDAATSEAKYDGLRRASTLETDMRIYARSRVTFRSNRPTKTRHLDTLSQCFYWCAHLVLQRIIYKDAPGSQRVQQTIEELVRLIKSMPPGCGPDSSLPFPFYLTAREAISPEHRTWVRERNDMLKKVYPGRIRDALMLLLEEIWESVDENRAQRETLDCGMDETIERLERSRDFCLF